MFFAKNKTIFLCNFVEMLLNGDVAIQPLCTSTSVVTSKSGNLWPRGMWSLPECEDSRLHVSRLCWLHQSLLLVVCYAITLMVYSIYIIAYFYYCYNYCPVIPFHPPEMKLKTQNSELSAVATLSVTSFRPGLNMMSSLCLLLLLLLQPGCSS